MKHPEYQYLDLLQDIIDNGSKKDVYNNPWVFIKSLFGRQIRFDLSKWFPLLTTKKVFLRGIIEELIRFLNGDSNIKYLVDHNVHIRNERAYKNYKIASETGELPAMTQEEFVAKIKELPAKDEFVVKRWELGPIYGRQRRKRKTTDGREIDQLGRVIKKLQETPNRKNYVVSAWNPEYIYEMALPGNAMALPPCHTIYHFCVTDGKLNCQLYQRSADTFLGVPFNIASYALLTMIVAQITGLELGEFVHTFGDVHLYSNHFDQAKLQMTREPKPFPTMKINPRIKTAEDLATLTYEDFTLEWYDPHPAIKGDITVVGGV